jgi:chromosomal replication initiation ATPase DnaA
MKQNAPIPRFSEIVRAAHEVSGIPIEVITGPGRHNDLVRVRGAIIVAAYRIRGDSLLTIAKHLSRDQGTIHYSLHKFEARSDDSIFNTLYAHMVELANTFAAHRFEASFTKPTERYMTA